MIWILACAGMTTFYESVTESLMIGKSHGPFFFTTLRKEPSIFFGEKPVN
jgi:hypothetical protein